MWWYSGANFGIVLSTDAGALQGVPIEILGTDRSRPKILYF